MPHRFYCPSLAESLLATSGSVQLDGTEAHHLLHVLRGKPGDSVELFDGQGLVAAAVIERSSRRDVTLSITAHEQLPAPSPTMHLATAVPKGDRFDWLIEKGTELGVTRFLPLRTEYSSVDPRETKLDRLRQTAIAACKQSGRAHLPQLSMATDFAEVLAKEAQGRRVLVADPRGERFDPLADGGSGRTQSTEWLLLIGPEGGFSPRELAEAQAAGARSIALPTPILRIETAAIALATLVNWWAHAATPERTVSERRRPLENSGPLNPA